MWSRTSHKRAGSASSTLILTQLRVVYNSHEPRATAVCSVCGREYVQMPSFVDHMDQVHHTKMSVDQARARCVALLSPTHCSSCEEMRALVALKMGELNADECKRTTAARKRRQEREREAGGDAGAPVQKQAGPAGSISKQHPGQATGGPARKALNTLNVV